MDGISHTSSLGHVARILFALVVGLLLLISSRDVSWATEPCEGPVQLDAPRLLRQMTLDLFQRVPSLEELEAVRDLSELDEDFVQSMVEDDEFFAFVRRFHKDLLWPALSNQPSVSYLPAFLLPAAIFEYDGDGDPDRLFLLVTGLYRRNGLVPCKDEVAEFDENGEPLLEEFPDGTFREGYVMVSPYWAPDTEVKVCALDARLHPFTEQGLPCNSVSAMFTGDCGCGPNLTWCANPEVVTEIQKSLEEQFLRMVERPIQEGRPYYDMLRDDEEELNGPLIHYYKHLAVMAVDPVVQVPPVVPAFLPDDVPYTDKSWQRHKRRSEHSGILTSMAYLLRFQTPRARANRFWSAFYCAPFQSPGLSLPSPSDPCSAEPDLRKRCGCNGCHLSLEPASAYWAKFSDAGTMYLDDIRFPPVDEYCKICKSLGPEMCSSDCERYYVTEAGHPDEEPYVGHLKYEVFRDEEELKRVHDGPSALVAQALETSILERCTVQRLFTRLIGRDPTTWEMTEMIPEWSGSFQDSGHDFKSLVKTLLMYSGYREVQP